MDKAGVAAVFFNGIAQIDQHIFPFLRKIDERVAMVGDVRREDGETAGGGGMVQHGSNSFPPFGKTAAKQLCFAAVLFLVYASFFGAGFSPP